MPSICVRLPFVWVWFKLIKYYKANWSVDIADGWKTAQTYVNGLE